MQIFLYLLYIGLPVLLAVGSVVGSGLIAWRQRRAVHACLSVAVLFLAAWALFTCYRIFWLQEREVGVIVIAGRERLNYLPYFAILAAFTIFAAQSFYVLGRKTEAR